MSRYLMVVGFVIAVTPSLADDTPLLKPDRDVKVEYRVTGTAQGPMGDGIMTMAFANKGALMRIDPPNGPGYMIVEPDSGRMTVVMPGQGVYMTMANGSGMVPMMGGAKGTYKKTGADTVADTSCTLYETSGTGHDGQVCLTADGVLLRGWSVENGARQSMEAVKVTYAAQPSSLFEPPPGFTKLDMPGMGGAAFPALGK